MQSRHDHIQAHPTRKLGDKARDVANLNAVANGDRAAFDRLYRDYYELLLRFCLRVTGRISLAEDVINETMIVVWRRASDYRATASVSTWIFGIAYRKSLKALAREGRANTSLADAPEPQAPETLEAEVIHAAIHRAIAELPPEHRAVVDLTFHFDCSYQEIAEILDCPVGTVKSRMFHARAKLRPMLVHLLGD